MEPLLWDEALLTGDPVPKHQGLRRAFVRRRSRSIAPEVAHWKVRPTRHAVCGRARLLPRRFWERRIILWLGGMLALPANRTVRPPSLPSETGEADIPISGRNRLVRLSAFVIVLPSHARGRAAAPA
jgi:hypothetical protein